MKSKLKENIDKIVERGSYSAKDFKELILDEVGNTGRNLNNIQMKKLVTNFKDGTTIKKGSVMQVLYGCDTCPNVGKATCIHGGRHTNGGCADRYQKIAYFLQKGLGDRIPHIEELLSELKFEAHNLKIRDMEEFGVISNKWIILQKIIGDLEAKLQKAESGTTIHIERDITYKDIRKKIIHVIDAKGEQIEAETE
jgi:hypothetical protein